MTAFKFNPAFSLIHCVVSVFSWCVYIPQYVVARSASNVM